MSVGRTGLPHTSHIPAPTTGGGAASAVLDPTTSGNGHRTPTALAPVIAQDGTTGAVQDPAAAPDARQQVRALVARERAGGFPRSPRQR